MDPALWPVTVWKHPIQGFPRPSPAVPQLCRSSRSETLWSWELPRCRTVEDLLDFWRWQDWWCVISWDWTWLNPLSPLNDGSLPRSTYFSELRSNRKFWEQEALLGVLRELSTFGKRNPQNLRWCGMRIMSTGTRTGAEDDDDAATLSPSPKVWSPTVAHTHMTTLVPLFQWSHGKLNNMDYGNLWNMFDAFWSIYCKLRQEIHHDLTKTRLLGLRPLFLAQFCNCSVVGILRLLSSAAKVG